MTYLVEALTWIAIGALVGVAVRPFINQIPGVDHDRLR